ncbi:SoxR reducing system RseC family protein [Photobacterium sp. TY1-4]|uniref:SoxR reducing system RseC family protein n=1 Tax=Photobacterium sp. TY1-4 TaxID=2899122 RepID=UPI0021C1E725|nr:SoxR reducing system RseC family protein [Photobacterium sp. TY1-4]UXI01744.1 SoxR reducing system RseC family protein [Photobacterium sp. TY1-4]
MMRSLATVVAVAPGQVTVSCQQETSCGHCASRDSCGTGIVSKAVPGRSHQIDIATRESVVVGDIVEIGLPEQSMLNSALLVYVLPLLCLILGAAFGQWWFVDLAGGGEPAVILSAVLSAGAGLLLARRMARRLEHQAAYKPNLIRVLGSPLAATQLINAAPKDSS